MSANNTFTGLCSVYLYFLVQYECLALQEIHFKKILFHLDYHKTFMITQKKYKHFTTLQRYYQIKRFHKTPGISLSSTQHFCSGRFPKSHYCTGNVLWDIPPPCNSLSPKTWTILIGCFVSITVDRQSTSLSKSIE